MKMILCVAVFALLSMPVAEAARTCSDERQACYKRCATSYKFTGSKLRRCKSKGCDSMLRQCKQTGFWYIGRQNKAIGPLEKR